MANTGKLMSELFTDAVLTRSLILFLILGSVAGLFAGATLLLSPGWMSNVSKRANRWVSTRQLARPLTLSIGLDSWFYRYNRFNGALLMAGSIYIVYFFTAVFDKAGALKNVFNTATVPPALMAGLIDALVLGGLTGAVFAAIVSLFLMLRPSLLREFEHGANQKISLRRALKPLEIQRDGLDSYVFKNVRWAGILILAGSLYTLVVLLSGWKNI
jgi:hypothetical protein